MLSYLLKLFIFANTNNFFFVKQHNSLNLSYKVEENMFKDRNYTNEFFISDSSPSSRYKIPIEDPTQSSNSNRIIFIINST